MYNMRADVCLNATGVVYESDRVSLFILFLVC